MVLLAADRQFPILCVLVQVDRWAGGLGWSSVFATSDLYRCCNRGEVIEGHRGCCSALDLRAYPSIKIPGVLSPRGLRGALNIMPHETKTPRARLSDYGKLMGTRK
jgi:hypothetical protein